MFFFPKMFIDLLEDCGFDVMLLEKSMIAYVYNKRYESFNLSIGHGRCIISFLSGGHSIILVKDFELKKPEEALLLLARNKRFKEELPEVVEKFKGYAKEFVVEM